MISRIDFTTGACAGGAGVSTATGYSGYTVGEILAVHVNYQGSPPAATTDFTLSHEGDPSGELIVNLVDQATDIKLYPRRLAEANDGTDATDAFVPYIVDGRLIATIAQANDADYCDITVWIRH